MDGWERFNKTSSLEKKEFYSNLTMDSITYADYKHAKIVWEKFGLQSLVQYHDLYVQNDTLLLADCLKVSDISV